MNLLRKARHIQIFGKSGKGKTTFAERYLMGSHHERIYIFDHQSEFSIRLGVPFTTSFDGFCEYAREHRTVVFDPSYQFAGYFEECFDSWCELVLEMAKLANAKGMESLLVCDEVQKVQNPSSPSLGLKMVLQTGRRAGLDTCLMSQQPNRVHNEMREQGTEFIFFNLTDKNSLKIPLELGIDPVRISVLPDLTYLWFDNNNQNEGLGELIY